MERTQLSFDKTTGLTEYFVWDDDNDTFHITTEMNVDSLVESNLVERNLDPGGYAGRDLKKVATIPMNVYMDLKSKGIINDKRKFLQWLNDRDNRVFRTSTGRV